MVIDHVAPDSPLSGLTGAFDSEDAHPGTRHRAASVQVVPATPSGEAWRLADGTALEQSPRRVPPRQSVIAAFDAAIPVSYPNRAWASALPGLAGAWDRTPLAGALILDVSSDRVHAGGYSLHLCQETGLVVEKVR